MLPYKRWLFENLDYADFENGDGMSSMLLNMLKTNCVFNRARFEASMGFHPPGQPSRKDKSTPRGRFRNFTLRVLLRDLEHSNSFDKVNKLRSPWVLLGSIDGLLYKLT